MWSANYLEQKIEKLQNELVSYEFTADNVRDQEADLMEKLLKEEDNVEKSEKEKDTMLLVLPFYDYSLWPEVSKPPHFKIQ